MPVPRFIVITGGVLSGLGKGVTTASIGKLLSRQFKVVPIKCDGYLNVDPGTMNPFEHGEVFVLDDGGEVDMDFGHYERFMGIDCKFAWNLTTGKVYNEVIKKERKGEYLGKTVQVIPHVTNEIKRTFRDIARKEEADFVLIEIGGTVGDIENSWFIEAVRQMKKEVGPENIMYVHLTYVPLLSNVGEQKTKPAQRDIKTLRELGLFPDIIVARSSRPLTGSSRKKIALFCDVDEEAVISGRDVESIYEIPFEYESQGMLHLIAHKFGFAPEKNMAEWQELIQHIKNPAKKITIAICGKYTALNDAYASIIEALTHAGANLGAKVEIHLLETTELEQGKISAEQALKGMDGIIVPIGFGSRGAEGKIACIKYAREHDLPFLGLCYGLQMAVVEFARNVCSLAGANSTEIDPHTPHPVVDILPEQKCVEELGGSMRLGSYDADLVPGSVVAGLYKAGKAAERHRHRWEVNPEYHAILKKHGLVFSGTSRECKLVEFIELPKHRFFVATQAHPEYKSRLDKPSPLFFGFVRACTNK